MPERADAARNRRKVLDAARRLYAERDPAEVTMAEVARVAGVAKGTLFHRFGDRAGLVEAVLGEAERELQDALLSGTPPLGPGAPPVERLRAFVRALAALTEANRRLLLVLDHGRPAARFRTGAHRAWVQHAAILLEEAGHADPWLRATVLLAPLSADLALHLEEDAGRRLDEVVAVLDALLAPPGDAATA